MTTQILQLASTGEEIEKLVMQGRVEEAQKLIREKQNGPPIIDTELKREITLEELNAWLSITIKRDDDTKQLLFLLSLLTYTDRDQCNVALKGGSSTGKSYIARNIIELHPKTAIHKLNFASPKQFFHGQGKPDTTGQYDKIINLERELIFFPDMPNVAVLEIIRSLLSKDDKEYVYSSVLKDRYGQNKTTKVLLRGYFTTIFCSADSLYHEQEQTRFFFLSPSDDQEKLKAAITWQTTTAENPEGVKQLIRNDKDLQTLRNRIEAIKSANVQEIIIPNAQKIQDEFLRQRPVLSPRSERDYPRLLQVIKALALLNFANRNPDKDGNITATESDIIQGLKLYAKIAESNELGLDPETYNVWTKVVYPLVEHGGTTDLTGLGWKYDEVKGRPISATSLRRLVEQMKVSALLEEIDDPLDRRRKLFRALRKGGQRTDRNSISDGSLATNEIISPAPIGSQVRVPLAILSQAKNV